MANQKLTDRNLMNEQLHDDDVIHIVDVSDTTDSPEGTSKKWKILTWLKTLFEDKSNKKTTLSDNSDTYYPTQKAVKTAVDAKQDALGFTPENIANKKTSLTDSDTDYPTGRAVKTALDGKEPTLTKGNLSGSGVITIDNTRQVIGGAATISHTDSATVRHVTDTEKATWNAKQNALGYTPENVANKRTSFQATPTDTAYPSEKLTKDSLDTKAPITSPTFATSITGSYLTASEILITDANKKIVSAPVATYPSLTELTYVKGVTSGIQSQLNNKQNTLGFTPENVANKKTTITDSDTDYLTSRAVKTAVEAKMANPMTTQGDIIYGGSSGTPTRLSKGTAGQVLTMNSGATAPQWSNPTAGGISWSVVTTDTTMAIDTGSLANKGTLLTLTLPATSAVGKTVRVAGMNTGLWKIAQGANQYIKFGNLSTTVGTGGSLASTQTYDAVELVCIEADKGWVVVSSIGNITVV